MNTVCLIGRLTRDPELRHTPSDVAVGSFTIAVDGAGDRGDDGKYAAGFFDVEVWDTQAENVAQYVSKGRQVGVTGSLRLHKWESQTGEKRSKVEIRAFRVDFIGSRPDSDGDSDRYRQDRHEESQDAPAYTPVASDDDIPF